MYAIQKQDGRRRLLLLSFSCRKEGVMRWMCSNELRCCYWVVIEKKKKHLEENKSTLHLKSHRITLSLLPFQTEEHKNRRKVSMKRSQVRKVYRWSTERNGKERSQVRTVYRWSTESNCHYLLLQMNAREIFSCVSSKTQSSPFIPLFFLSCEKFLKSYLTAVWYTTFSLSLSL